METLPLSGIKIVAATTGVAGPYADMVFGDLGADLIRVGAPGLPFWPNSNRNKRSININLKTEEGKEIMRKLLKTADVFFENFAPGVIDGFDFSYEVVSKIKPDIVYVTLKGYGDGPYGQMPAWDPCIEAQSGIMDTLREDSNKPPNRICGPNIDKTTGLYCVFVSMVALLNKNRTGKGDYVRCDMFEDAASIQGQNIALYSLYKRLWGQIGPGIGAASCFKVKDKWVAIDASRDEDWQGFCDAFKIADAERKTFATKESRDKYSKIVNDIIKKAVSNKFSYSVVEKLREAKVPCEPIETWRELTARELPAEAGAEDMLPLRCDYYNLDSDEKWRRPPKFGEHTVEIMKELSYSDQEIDELRKKKIVSTDVDEGLR